MSLPMKIQVICSICRKKSAQTVMASTNTRGTPDLDLRPPEMMRSTMAWWIQECPKCGYVSTSLDDKISIKRRWLKQNFYKNCNNRNFSSALAARFYKHYLIKAATKNAYIAFSEALHAAWVCDDAGDTENAIHCRLCALEELDKILNSVEKTEDLVVIRADLLRRTGQFDTLITEYAGNTFSDDVLNKITAFQIEKAKEQDTACYRVEDAVPACD